MFFDIRRAVISTVVPSATSTGNHGKDSQTQAQALQYIPSLSHTPISANNHQVNPRSRASKRAASPLPTDKSLSNIPRAADATPILAAPAHKIANGGIQKSKKKTKPLKRGQLRRQEKGLQRAEIVLDQLERKKVEAKERGKKVKGRARGWEEINEGAEEEVRKTPRLGLGNGVNGEGDGEGDGEWEDVNGKEEGGDTEMGVVEVEGVQVKVPANAALTKVVMPVRPASNAGSDLEDIT